MIVVNVWKQKLEDARKGLNPNRDNVSAKDIVSGIISAANRKMLRAATGSSKPKKDSGETSVVPSAISLPKVPSTISIADIRGAPRPTSRRNSESVLQGGCVFASKVNLLSLALFISH